MLQARLACTAIRAFWREVVKQHVSGQLVGEAQVITVDDEQARRSQLVDPTADRRRVDSGRGGEHGAGDAAGNRTIDNSPIAASDTATVLAEMRSRSDFGNPCYAGRVRRHQLLDEERVPLAEAMDLIDRRWVHGVTGDRGDELASGSAIQSSQVPLLRSSEANDLGQDRAQRVAARQFIEAVRTHEQHRVRS